RWKLRICILNVILAQRLIPEKVAWILLFHKTASILFSKIFTSRESDKKTWKTKILPRVLLPINFDLKKSHQNYPFGLRQGLFLIRMNPYIPIKCIPVFLPVFLRQSSQDIKWDLMKNLIQMHFLLEQL